MKRIKFFASILLMLCLSVVCCAQTKIDWKQIKNIPDTLEFKNVLLEHLLFKSAYQPVMESIHMGGIYYDNMTERMRIYENGQWRDLSVTIASDSIGAPLTILGYLQANDIYASNTAYIKNGVLATGTSVFDRLKVNNALKVPTVTNTSLGVGSIYYDTSANKLKVLNSSNQWKVVSVDVDSALSSTSTNPVQNKAIYSKFDNFEANVAQQLEQTLLDSYNYANGIATKSYNYTDATATNTKNYADNSANNAYTAAKQYADTQIRVIDGRINTLNTNLLASLTQGLTSANASASLYASSAVTISESYAQGLSQTTYNAATAYTDALRTYVDSQDTKTLASASKLFVSSIASGDNNGTIKYTKNGSSYNVAVKGLGSAAYANVASFSNGLFPSYSSSPSNPVAGQVYFDTSAGVARYYNGATWIDLTSSGGGGGGSGFSVTGKLIEVRAEVWNSGDSSPSYTNPVLGYVVHVSDSIDLWIVKNLQIRNSNQSSLIEKINIPHPGTGYISRPTDGYCVLGLSGAGGMNNHTSKFFQGNSSRHTITAMNANTINNTSESDTTTIETTYNFYTRITLDQTSIEFPNPHYTAVVPDLYIMFIRGTLTN